MYSLGIDVGTTNCKICLYRISDFELISKYSFNTPKIMTVYGSDFDINAIWQGIIDGLTTTALSVDDPQNIVTLAVASVGEAGVLMDDQANIIGPVMTWYDTRAQPQSEKVIDRLGEALLYEITGIPAHSNYSLNKILWGIENAENAKPASWLCLAEYIAFRLSGIKRAEYSLASRTLAFDIKSGTWSEKICQAMALPKGLFSPLVAAGEPIGNIKQEVSQITGLSEETRISIAGHDHMSGSVAVGVIREDQILNSTGTTEGLLVVRDQPSVTDAYFQSKVSNGQHVLAELFTLYASLPSAGYAIEWFKTLFGVSSADFDHLTQSLLQRGAADEASESFLMPHLRGSGPPKRSIFAKGLIYGLGEKTEPEDILQALFQGLCFELRLLLESYEKLTGQYWETVMVIGAACQNPYWLQLKANVLNRNILACRIPEAVSKGAAIIGAKGAGYQTGTRALPDEMQILYQPNTQSAAHFRGIFEQVYRPLYESKMKIENQVDRNAI
ncbi:FGGY family carbohydrate kinase [Rouxiella sp. T17]|uniref:FGGY-family carbohydrate kinase n=1 Tax=Rouxiella sp. T17 TaxID=3085684 RepID=UPI002FC5937E